MLKKILGVLAVVIIGLAAYVVTRPDTYHVERSIEIGAPAPVIFPSVGDLRAFGEWSPWDKRDPAMKKTYSDTTSGVGASYAWEGNKQVGKGKMTIVESRPPEHVGERLEFIEPFASVADIAMDLKPAGVGTRVTWSMDGKNNFVGKAFGLIMNMDKTVGGDFVAGLANLKGIAEARQAALVKEAAARAAAAQAAAAAAVAVAPADAKPQAAPNGPKPKKK